MSKKTIQLVPWSTFVGGMLETLFKTIFCSSAWLRASVVKVETKKGWMVQIDSDHYPPGGPKGTGMVYCPTCRRWAPRSWGTDLQRQVNCSMPGCTDCLVESQIESFEQHLYDLPDKTFAEELKRLSWGPASARYLIIQSQRECAEAMDDYDPNTGEIEYQYRVMRSPYWEMFDAHCDWVGKDTNSSEQRYNLLWEIEGKADGSRFSRRSLGCHEILLNEDEASLLKEIRDYQNTHNLLPSVKRNNII